MLLDSVVRLGVFADIAGFACRLLRIDVRDCAA